MTDVPYSRLALLEMHAQNKKNSDHHPGDLGKALLANQYWGKKAPSEKPQDWINRIKREENV